MIDPVEEFGLTGFEPRPVWLLAWPRLPCTMGSNGRVVVFMLWGSGRVIITSVPIRHSIDSTAD